MDMMWLRGAIATFKPHKKDEVVLRFRSESDRDKFITWLLKPAAPQQKCAFGLPLKSDYRFQTLIETEGIRVAKGVCLGVARAARTVFNPLYIHGPSGCGKTHLLQATCAEAKETEKEAVYLTAEAFLNLLTENKHGISSFIKKMAEEVDILCVDDILFLKEHPKTAQRLSELAREMAREKKPLLLAGQSPPSKVRRSVPQIERALRAGLNLAISPLTQEEKIDVASKIKSRFSLDVDLSSMRAGLLLCETVGDVMNFLFHHSQEPSDPKQQLLIRAVEKVETLFGQDAPKKEISLLALRQVLGLKEAKSIVHEASKGKFSYMLRKARSFIEKEKNGQKKLATLLRFLEEYVKLI